MCDFSFLKHLTKHYQFQEIVAEEELEGDEPSESVSNKNDGEDSESKPPKSPIKSAFGDESSFLNDSFDSVKE